MMKKLVFFMLFLMLGIAANATLYITVNGEINPADSTINIVPSTWLSIGVYDDQQTSPGILSMGLTDGPGSLSIGKAVMAEGVTAEMVGEMISLEIGGSQTGMLIDEIDFHCDGPWDVTIAVTDENGQIVDTQVIHQTPEPMTIALLGLGGLLLRRKIA